MRSLIYGAAASLALFCAVGSANAVPADHFTRATVPSNVEQAQYIFGGRRYCWYFHGWHGPGWYWCGYSWRRGYGWGGGAGWRGWHYRGRGGHVVVRPGHGYHGHITGRPRGHMRHGHMGHGGHHGGGHSGGGHGGGGRGAGHGGGHH